MEEAFSFSKYLNHPQAKIFLLTWFICEVLLFFSIRFANKWQLHDLPTEERKIHDRPIPTIGGLPIFIAFFLGIYLTQDGWGAMKPVLLGSFICMILGLIDDLKPISAVIKLFVLFAITYFIYDHSGTLDHDGVKITLFPWAELNLIISLFWIVGMMSAINSLDNMDGLASGITAIASLFIFFIAWAHWQQWLSFMAIALCAGCLTFLKYNFFQPKAGIFLGDNGSYFIGFTLACMAMMGAWTNPDKDYSDTDRLIKAVIVPPLLLGVPIFDIITATVLRLVNGEVKTLKHAIVYCGTDHTSHRLVALGFSKRMAVSILWGLGALLGLVSLLIMKLESILIYLPLAGLTFIGLFLFACYLNKAKVYDHQIHQN
jgi:UDP-GlcNAc:undecaprenyl-phosphate GlcNAc-1-phosphate transferase